MFVINICLVINILYNSNKSTLFHKAKSHILTKLSQAAIRVSALQLPNFKRFCEKKWAFFLMGQYKVWRIWCFIIVQNTLSQIGLIADRQTLETIKSPFSLQTKLNQIKMATPCEMTTFMVYQKLIYAILCSTHKSVIKNCLPVSVFILSNLTSNIW